MISQAYETYVLFDRSTGAIVGTYVVYDAGIGSYRTPTREEAWVAFRGLLEDRMVDQVDLMTADLPMGSLRGAYYVDVGRHQLVPQSRLRVQAERTRILGDGKDAVEITISALDEAGNVVESFDGDLRVRTTRGRLSALGGRTKANHGQAQITLTSVAETIDRVSITVQDLSGRCTQGHLDIEFL